MRRALLAVAFCASSALMAAAQDEVKFETNPNSPELQALAKPMVVDESKYGCGPLREPGKTYCVKPDGDDKADGLSWATALQHIRQAVLKLKAGDTLLIGEGEYCEHLEFGSNPLLGEPGRPIRIMAAPRQRVVLSAAQRVGPFRPREGTRFTFEVDTKKPTNIELYTATWEADSLNVLEPAGSAEAVERLPGTFFFDEAKNKLYVRFSDGRPGAGRHIYMLRYHRGLCIDGRYVLVQGLQVKHAPFYGFGVRGQHITVEDCVMVANWGSGMYLGGSAQWNLIKNNYGIRNEYRGTVMTTGENCTDNLFIGNHCDPSPPSGRSGRENEHWAINNYGGVGARCHVISNLFNDGRAFRWKPAVRETVFQGNVCVGTLYCTGTKIMGWTDPSQRMIVRNNTIVGGVAWAGEPLGPDGFNGDWATADKAALNNFVANHDAKAIESARFADPAYNDYRLQSDSPLIGLALAGGDRGAFRQASGRILYVGQKGADSAPGTSERLAFKTFARACAELRPGDTLYVLDALYREPLVVQASGAPAQPIRIRAYQRRSSALPGIVLAGSHLHLEGFRVRQSPGDGILVKGGDVRVERCRVDRAAGAGLRADGAKGLTVNHCTFVSNDCGVALVNGSTEATLRNSIVAQNRTTTMTVDESSQTGYRGYNTCYFGPGLDAQRVAAETDSLVADPRFVTPDRNDYRLTWDSPARYLGEFGRPAGSESVVQRTVQIHGVATRNLQPESAVISWQTPEDDTLGRVRFKPKGAGEWQTVQSVEQGTEHVIGLVGLQPGTAYEFQVTAVARRGGEATSDALTFRTPTESRPPMELYVSPTGDDAADGRSPARAWRTVRKACVEALPGDTVRVAPGVYHDPIAPIATGLPGRRITFRRWGQGEVVIDGGEVVARLCELAYRSHVTIDGFTFQCAIPKEYPPAIIHVGPGKDIEILNCCTRKTEGRFCGESILADSVQGLRIEGNVFAGQRYNLRSYFGSSDFVIRNNTFGHHSVMAFALKRTPNVTIVNNIFYQPKGRTNPYIGLWVDELDCGLVLDCNLYAPAPDMRVVDLKQYRDTPGGRVEDFKMPGDTLENWQRLSGQDKHSLWADPLFVDAEKGDFRLRPGSPAIGKGQGGVNIGALGVAK